MKNMLFKSLIAMFLVITLCSLTACGGGGGSSNSSLPPTTAKVKVSIPANLFDDANLNPDVRAAVTVQKLKVRATPYLNGTYVQDSEHPAVFGEASQKDNNFVADLSNISKTYDYRFSVLFGEGANEKELLNSYVSVASITEGASFKVDDISTKKVLAYEKWLENNPTDKKFNNFLTECSKEASKIGYTEDLYFDSLVNFPVSDLKESLVKITSGTDSNASLPTTASVDTEKLPAIDNNPVNPDNPVNPTDPTAKYANLTGKILPAQNSNVTSFEVGVYSAAGLEQKKNVNANSTFTFEKLPVGTYTLVISSDETLNIIREISLVGSETKEITDGRNDYIQASKVQGTFTPVQDGEFARVGVYVFVQGGSDVYYQVTDGSDGVTIAKQYDEVNNQTLTKDIFDAYRENDISIYTTSKVAGSVKVFFKNSTNEIVFEKVYPLTYSYPNTAMNQTNTGYTLNLTATITLDLIRCEPGTFLMGSPENEFGKYGNEYEKQHSVTLTKPFYLGKFEVTRDQFNAIMNYYAGYQGYDRSEFRTSGNLPVHNIVFTNASHFCEILNEIFADSIPTGYKFDLPSEAQWEYACRAGTTSAFNNGRNIIATSTELNFINWETYDDGGLSEIEWYLNNSASGPHEVGTKSPNQWGFYDMHGNVEEYCRDMYEGDISDYPDGSVTDPVAVSSNNYVWCPIRGGSWSSLQQYCRAATRSVFQHSNYAGALDHFEGSNVGFRLALVPIQ